MSPAKKPSPTPPASGSREKTEAYHTCVSCPVCATEACRVLEDLGMYCETMCAASEAKAARKRRKRVAA